MTAITLAHCAALDAADPLADRRAQFSLPPNITYLDGNSLGALPAATPAALADLVQRQWGTDLIASWNRHGWIDAPHRIAAAIAPLIGAAADEVLVADTASINLFRLAAAALPLRPGRRAIVAEAGSFPTDLYMLQGLQSLLPDLDLRIVPPDSIPAALDADVALLLLNHVHYRTGRRWNMAALTAAAHEAGALALWDVCHSAGAVAVDLGATRADLAVGCGYKFLNGGPGAPSFLYVAARHLHAIANPLCGWLGHAAPFAFTDAYRPAEGIRRMLCSSPSIIAGAALEAGLAVFAGITPAALEAKADSLATLFLALAAQLVPQLSSLTPPARADRAAQVSLVHPHAYPVMQCLIAHGVIGDFREPDILRFGLAPLTTRHTDVFTALSTLAHILAAGSWQDPRHAIRAAVT